MYHIIFFSVPLEKRSEVPKFINTVKKIVKNFKGIELIGFFFPRGSGYMYAIITKYQNYATWEKFWINPKVIAVRQKANVMITKQMDMFFDEITYAYPELHK